MRQTKSPFKFLDSYQKTDGDVFFGRQQETHDLYDALSGVKHLLVYGPSGSGKTSLVECGLRNQFSDADWFALTIRKGRDINASVFLAINEALMEKIELDPKTKLPKDSKIGFGEAIEKLFEERFQPIYLLFDQFEELLITGEQQEKVAFFTNLNTLIRNRLPSRVLLILREEFIGHFSEFESLCPSIFQHRFRVEKMGRKQVQEVIHDMLEAPRYREYFDVKDSVALSESILEKLPDKRKEIELSHVQVFLGLLWDRANENRKEDSLPVFNKDLIRRKDNLESVLESFLKKQIKELEGSFGKNIPMELLAVMISDRFTKLQLSEADILAELEDKKIKSTKPIAELLEDFEQRRIIRSLKVGDEQQYEISHDTLALVVGQNLTEEMKMREKALDVYSTYNEQQGFYSQENLDHLRAFEIYLAYPSSLKKRIKESEANIKADEEEKLEKQRKQLRRTRKFAIIISIIGIGAIIAAGFAIFYSYQANEAQKDIISKSDRALSYQLIWEAQTLSEEDPTLALRLADAASLINSEDTTIIQEKYRIYNDNTFYKIIVSDSSAQDSSKISNDFYNPFRRSEIKVLANNETILYKDPERQVYDLLNLQGKRIDSLEELQYMKLSPSEDVLLGITHNSEIKLWDIQGNILSDFNYSGKNVDWARFLPDGKSLIVHSRESGLQIISLDGKIKEELENEQARSAPTWNLEQMMISPDGRFFILGNNIFDLEGNIIKTFDRTPLDFSITGDTVYTASLEDGQLSMWDRKGNITKLLRQFNKPVELYSISPNRKKILAFFENENKKLKADIFEIQTRKSRVIDVGSSETTEKVGGKDYTIQIYIESHSWSPDGNYALVKLARRSIQHQGYFRDAKLLDLARQGSDTLYSEQNIANSKFSPDGKNILSISLAGAAQILDLSGKPQVELNGHKKKINTADFFPNGKTIITSSDDNTIRLWDLKGLSTSRKLVGHSDKVQTVTILSDTLLATGSDDKTIRLWNFNGDEIGVLRGHESPVWSLAFSPDGSFLLSGASGPEDTTIRLWDVEEMKELKKFQGHSAGIHAVAFSPISGDTILSGSHDRTIRLWNLEGKELKAFPQDSVWSRIHTISYSRDGKRILSGHWDVPEVILWDTGGKLINRYQVPDQGGVNSLSFAPDGKAFIYGTWNGKAFFQKLEGDTIMVKEHKGAVNSVDFSPIGHSFATAVQEEKSFNIWNLKGVVTQKLIGHTDQMNAIAYSENGKYILTGANDNTAILWEIFRPLEDFLKNGNVEPLTEIQKKHYGIQEALERLAEKKQ